MGFKFDEPKVIAAINARRKACPGCGSAESITNDSFFITPTAHDTDHVAYGAEFAPTVAVICKQCALVSQYAVTMLGLPGS